MKNEENNEKVEVKTGQTEETKVPTNKTDNAMTKAGETNFNGPFTMMRHIAEDMENMFADFGFGSIEPRMSILEKEMFGGSENDFFRSPFKQSNFFKDFSPPVEVVESDGKLIVRTDLPGLEKDDIKVEVRDNRLTIEGERKNESEEKGENFYRSERSFGSFYRQVPLPETVDTEDAKASFKNGVLEVTLAAPKLASGGKRLEITDESTEKKTAASG